jgi:hypothetical protein
METLKNFWKWLSGKKTIIGLIGTNIMQMDLVFIANMNPDLEKLLMYIFMALAAGGLTHKVLKKKK